MDSTTPDAQIPPIRHTGSVHGAALSPCGHYLAVGTGIEIPEGAWHTEYEDGGVLHVFELATGGRVAGIVEPGALRGGVGWTDYPGAIQWSADSARLGLAYDTNMVGVWDVFSGAQGPAATAYVTDGGNRPPSFALAPDGRRALIDLGPVDECGVPGILVPLDGGDLSWYHADADPAPAEGEPRLMASALGAPFEETPGESQLGMERAWGWDRDGTRVHVVDFHDVYAIDIATGRPLWIRQHGVDYSWWDGVAPAAFSPDGTRVAWYTADRLHLADAATGRTTADLDREEAAVLVWGRDRPSTVDSSARRGLLLVG
ncbi:MAG TPA: hypothetical protein VGF17_04495, partial [Phytomonospora sp.]